MLPTVVTVVFNAEGLRRTIASVRPHLNHVEHWVIDGSTTAAVRDLTAREADPGVQLLSKPDRGLYDAMNKGLDRASGGHVMFINAGDMPALDLRSEPVSRRRAAACVIGFTIERSGRDRYAKGQVALLAKTAL